MSKTDEHKIDNQWIPCAKRMPTEGVAWYLVTLQKHEKRWVEYLYYTWAGSSYKYAFQRQTGEPIDAKIIAWMLKPKPYQPPEEIPEEPDTKSVKIGEVYQIFSKDQTNLVRSINIVDPADPLMGWIPTWQQLPKSKNQKILTLINGQSLFGKEIRIMPGYYNPDNNSFTICNYQANPQFLRYDNWGEIILAWMDEPARPDLKLLNNPYFPPGNAHFDLKFIPFSESLPTKNGKYLLYNKENGKWDPWRIDNHKALSMLNHYNRYTHWALIRKEK